MKQLVKKITTALTAATVNFNLDYEGFLGVELSPNNWSWFVVNPDGHLTFDYTYSANTGRSKKRLIHRTKKCAALARVLGFDACATNAPEPAQEVAKPGKIKAAAPKKEAIGAPIKATK